MQVSTTFSCQNWLITPAALAAFNDPQPTTIHDQKWLLVLSGVVKVDFKTDSAEQWLREDLAFLPDMKGPLNWAINRFAIPTPPGGPDTYNVGFSLEEWAPFASPSSLLNQDRSVSSGLAVDSWRPAPFSPGPGEPPIFDVLTNQRITNIFNGIRVDVAVSRANDWILRVGYNITLLGKIVFIPIIIL
jgi:hypothetical protein